MNTQRHPHVTATATAADFLIASRQCEIRNLEHFLQMGRLVQSVGNLVHGLQRERGATNLFLGSGGQCFARQRDLVLKQNEQLASIFREALADIQHDLTDHPVSSPLLGHIAGACTAPINFPAAPGSRAVRQRGGCHGLVLRHHP